MPRDVIFCGPSTLERNYTKLKFEILLFCELEMYFFIRPL